MTMEADKAPAAQSDNGAEQEQKATIEDTFYEDESSEEKKPTDEDAGEDKPDEESTDEGGEEKSEEEGDTEQEPGDYEDFTLPEGANVDAEIMGKFTALAKESKLTQEAAQEVVNIGMELAQKAAGEVQAAIEQSWADQREAWVKEIKGDKELGGKKFEETIQRANRVLERFADPSMVEYLDQSGFGDNAHLVRFLAKVDSAMSEDSAIGVGSAGGGVNLDVKDVWYD